MSFRNYINHIVLNNILILRYRMRKFSHFIVVLLLVEVLLFKLKIIIK